MNDIAGSSKERIIADLDAAIAACKKTLGGRIGMSTAQFEALRSFVAAQPAHEPLLEASQRATAIALEGAGAHAERVLELESEVSTLRDSLAEANRLLSLNVAEVERLRASQPPGEALDYLRRAMDFYVANHVGLGGLMEAVDGVCGPRPTKLHEQVKL